MLQVLVHLGASGVDGQFGGMGSLENVRPDSDWDPYTILKSVQSVIHEPEIRKFVKSKLTQIF